MGAGLDGGTGWYGGGSGGENIIQFHSINLNYLL